MPPPISTLDFTFRLLGVIVIVSPLALVALLGLTSLLNRRLSEEWIGRLVPASIVTGLCAATTILAMMLFYDRRFVPIEIGHWIDIPHYHFVVKFVFDRLSVPFVILALTLCGTIGAFANRYMHREPGFNRFFVLFSLFVLGIVVTPLAGTIETLFAGWELVGLSSALLVAFYHERASPVKNGLRVWGVYRVSDAALLLASVALHHLTGDGDFSKFLGRGIWPEGHSTLEPQHALIVGVLLVVAAAGKSALVPFSGWLPRAMEGPTPSSAVFYGALSVHLGAYLLLRVSPILDDSFILSILVILVGLVTAVFATLTEKAQSDIKSALSFASLCQVGIIVTEVGLSSLFTATAARLGDDGTGIAGRLGYLLHYVALVHLLGHACLRTLQFLRAPTILLDVRSMENALGERLPHPELAGSKRIGPRFRMWVYRLALERGYLDAMINRWVIGPFLAIFRWCDAAERRWTDFLARKHSRESDDLEPAVTPFEDLL